MTTFAALLGAVPLAIGVGPGSELRRPLGIAIIGGLMVSQVLTLYTTPIIYLLLDKLHRRLWGTAARAPAPPRRAGGVSDPADRACYLGKYRRGSVLCYRASCVQLPGPERVPWTVAWVLPANTMLDGTYRIARVVGSGGFGITYEAEDINLATTSPSRSTTPSTSATATPP